MRVAACGGWWRSSRLAFALSGGYIYYATLLIEGTASLFGTGGRVSAVIMLGLLATVASVRSWWRPVAGFGVANGLIFLSLTLMTPWRGLWTHASWLEEPKQFDSVLVQGLLVVAAPALAIGWRVGLRPANVDRWTERTVPGDAEHALRADLDGRVVVAEAAVVTSTREYLGLLGGYSSKLWTGPAR